MWCRCYELCGSVRLFSRNGRRRVQALEIGGEVISFMEIRDCDLLVTTTGLSAGNLQELKDCIAAAPTGSIYHHFYGRLLRPEFDEPEYNNDFASWVNWNLRDKALAEKLSMVVPSTLKDLEQVREKLLQVIDERMEEVAHPVETLLDERFYLLRAHMVVFDAGLCLEEPEDLFKAIDSLHQGSIYYHIVDARHRRLNRGNDFSEWFRELGSEYVHVADRLAGLDPYFSSVEGIRRTLGGILESSLPEHDV